MPTQELLKYHFTYDPQTGILRWKVPTCKRTRVGDVAGSHREYITIKLFGKEYPAHRLAWLYTYGHLPKLIDHKNRNKYDNRLSNLRIATHSENAYNKSIASNNTVRIAGTYFDGKRKVWRVRIQCNGKRIHVGTFTNKKDAAVARAVAERNYFGEFASSNGGN